MQSKKIRLLYVGRISWHKGTDILNEVAEKMPNFIKITVIGFGDYPLSKKIEFLGRKEPTEVAEVMRNSGILIHPSRMEGLCRVIQEAQATALPVVCADVGGNRELVQHMKNGLLVKLEATAFTNATLLLAQNKDLRRRLGNEALLNSQRFDWDKTVTEYQKVMEEIVEIHRKG